MKWFPQSASGRAERAEMREKGGSLAGRWVSDVVMGVSDILYEAGEAAGEVGRASRRPAVLSQHPGVPGDVQGAEVLGDSGASGGALSVLSLGKGPPAQPVHTASFPVLPDRPLHLRQPQVPQLPLRSRTNLPPVGIQDSTVQRVLRVRTGTGVRAGAPRGRDSLRTGRVLPVRPVAVQDEALRAEG